MAYGVGILVFRFAHAEESGANPLCRAAKVVVLRSAYWYGSWHMHPVCRLGDMPTFPPRRLARIRCRLKQESPTLARVGLWFFGGGFGLWDEVFDRVAPFAYEVVGADGADSDLHEGAGGKAGDGGAGAGGGFGRGPYSAGGFVLDFIGTGLGHGGPHDVELGGLVAKGDGDGGHFWHAGGGDGRGFEVEHERADFARYFESVELSCYELSC